MGLALVSVLWAYDGWGDLSFAAGEVKNPQRNLPRAIILGTLALIGIYVLTNVAYLYVIPITEIADPRTPLVAADTMMALFGRGGVVLVSIFVMISSFSSLNGSMLASPRVFFAMADDGLFFETIAKVHPALQDAVRRDPAGGRARHGARDEPQLRGADRHVRPGDLAVLRARHRGDLPAAAPAAGHAAAVSSDRLSGRARDLHRLGRGVRRQRARSTTPISTAITFALILAGLPVYQFAFATAT